MTDRGAFAWQKTRIDHVREGRHPPTLDRGWGHRWHAAEEYLEDLRELEAAVHEEVVVPGLRQLGQSARGR